MKGTISTYISALIPTLPGDIRISGKSASASSRLFSEYCYINLLDSSLGYAEFQVWFCAVLRLSLALVFIAKANREANQQDRQSLETYIKLLRKDPLLIFHCMEILNLIVLYVYRSLCNTSKAFQLQVLPFAILIVSYACEMKNLQLYRE